MDSQELAAAILNNQMDLQQHGIEIISFKVS
jgi:hypothetical protein